MLDFFFFKQKTAYEMRISDWSSDVCSSDLRLQSLMDGLARIELARLEQPRHVAIELVHARKEIDHDETLHPDPRADRPREIAQFGRPRDVVDEIGRASCRERGCQYV